MRIAITGASGLIGSALRSSLEADGHTVVALVRRAPAPDEQAVAWDPAAGTIDAGGLEGLDAVVHLAGEGIGTRRWSDAQRARIRDSRVLGTRLLSETLASLSAPPAVLVSGSAIGFYGDGGDTLLDETSPSGDRFLAEVCREWEAAARPASDAGIRTALARTGIVLDPAGGALAKTLPLFKLGLGGKMGSGRQWWSWISLPDEVAALRWLIEADIEGPVNLTAPEPVTNAEFTRTLGSVLGRPTVLAVPAFGPRLLLGRELADELLFTSARVDPAVLRAEGFEFAHPELETGLRAVLGR